MAAIEINELTKIFRGKRFAQVKALQQLSLTVKEGEIYGFLGPNGAGKSTTIKCLMGLIRQTSGTTRLAGLDATTTEARKKVGYLPENPSFYDFLSAAEYLRFVGKTFSLPSILLEERTEKMLHLLELWDARNRPIRSYSKGMVQRVGLAQALIHDPEILIFDEPMSGLDPLGRALVKKIMIELKRAGKTIFFSTHITDDVEKVCDRVGVIVSGVMQEEREVSSLLQEGIDGYLCRIKGAVIGLDEFNPRRLGEGVQELYIPRGHFDLLAQRVLTSGGTFDLIEPKRHDIEDFFLALVSKAKKANCKEFDGQCG